jgi:gas vesicle protein
MTQQRRIDDAFDPWSAARYRRGPGAGSLFMATMLGVGVGLLAAPQAGSKTRKLLRKRLASLSGEVSGLGDVQEIGSKARKRARQQLAKLRENAGEEMGERWERARSRIRDFGEEDESSPFGSLVAIALGVAATYFLTSDRAAPVRSRVQEAATGMRRRASDQWDRFQRGGTRAGRETTGIQENRAESRATSSSADEASSAS